MFGFLQPLHIAPVNPHCIANALTSVLAISPLPSTLPQIAYVCKNPIKVCKTALHLVRAVCWRKAPKNSGGSLAYMRTSPNLTRFPCLWPDYSRHPYCRCWVAPNAETMQANWIAGGLLMEFPTCQQRNCNASPTVSRPWPNCRRMRWTRQGVARQVFVCTI